MNIRFNLLLLLLLGSVPGMYAAEKPAEEITAVAELPITASTATAVKRQYPAVTSAEIQTGEDGVPYLALKISGKWTRPADFTLPLTLNIPPDTDPAKTADRLRVVSVMRAPHYNGFTAWLEFRDQAGKQLRARYRTAWPVWSLITFDHGKKDWSDWRTEQHEAEVPFLQNVKTVFHSCGVLEPAEYQIRSLKIYRVVSRNHRIESGAPGHVINAEKADILVRPYRPAEITAGAITVTDEHGKVLWKRTFGSNADKISLFLPKRGYYGIAIEAKYTGGRTVRRETSAVVAGPALPPEERMAGRFGIGHLKSDLTAWGKAVGLNSTYGSWDLTNIVQKDGGLLYDSSEPGEAMTSKNSVYQEFDNIAQLNRPIPDFMVDQTGRRRRFQNLPRSFDTLKEAVRLWAKNVPTLPAYIDIYNESNGILTPEEAADMYKALASGKEENPDLKICGPCTSEISIPYLKAFAAAGGFSVLDAVNIHNYSQAELPEAQFLYKTKELLAFLREHRLDHLPVIFSEYGWTTPPGDWQRPVDELTRSRYTARASIIAAALGIKRLLPFAARFNISEEGLSYSMVRSDNTPTPAVAVLAALVRELNGAAEKQLIRFSNTGYLALFRKNGNSLAIFWSTGKNITVKLPEAPVTIRNMTGAEQPPAQTLTIGPEVLYCTFSGTAFADLKLLPCRTVRAGEAVAETEPDFRPFLIPDYFRRTKNGFEIAPEAAPGECAALSFSSRRGYVCRPYLVKKAVEVRYDSYRAVAGAPDSVLLKFTLIRNRADIREARFTMKRFRFDKKEKTDIFRKNVTFGRENQVEIEVPVSELHAGMWHVTETAYGKEFAERTHTDFKELPMLISLLPATAPENIPWGELPVAHFPPFTGKAPIPSASFRICAVPKGLAIRLQVKDEEHVPDLTRDLWNRDSVQAAFDFDYGKPYVPNQLHSRLFDGHRVVQYGIAGNNRENAVFCFEDCLENIRKGKIPLLERQCSVRRDEEKKLTTYDLFFPWNFLGEKSMPSPGREIGFSLLVNDAGTGLRRRTLAFADGIYIPDPRAYGKAIFIENHQAGKDVSK